MARSKVIAHSPLIRQVHTMPFRYVLLRMSIGQAIAQYNVEYAVYTEQFQEDKERNFKSTGYSFGYYFPVRQCEDERKAFSKAFACFMEKTANLCEYASNVPYRFDLLDAFRQ
jgi:hypothetical protein